MSPKMFGPCSKGKDGLPSIIVFSGSNSNHHVPHKKRTGWKPEISMFFLLVESSLIDPPVKQTWQHKKSDLVKMYLLLKMGHFNDAMLVHQMRYIIVLLVMTFHFMGQIFQNMGPHLGSR